MLHKLFEMASYSYWLGFLILTLDGYICKFFNNSITSACNLFFVPLQVLNYIQIRESISWKYFISQIEVFILPLEEGTEELNWGKRCLPDSRLPPELANAPLQAPQCLRLASGLQEAPWKVNDYPQPPSKFWAATYHGRVSLGQLIM